MPGEPPVYRPFALLALGAAVADLPLLDARLTPDAARAMFEAMEAAAGQAKARQREPAPARA